MPNPYFLLFELIIYLQLAFCLHHAWNQGIANVLRLFTGVFFGLSLELATIRQLNAYEYGRSIIMFLDVPFCIGVAWGCILYSAMGFSDASSLPYWTRPVFDGLFALNVDLALDAIAIRLGFWDWGQGLEFQYFGVPYANFWAWFWVVFFFSLGYRLFARRPGRLGTWLAPLSALLTGLTGVLSTNALITFVIPWDYTALTVAGLLAAALVLIVALRARFYLTPVAPLVFWVPFLTHAYAFVAGLISGVILEPPFLLFVSLLMIVIALWLHRPTFKHLFVGRSI